VLPGTIHVAALLNNIPRSNVSATLTSGDPVPALTLSLIGEYVHAHYQDNTIPHTQTQTGLSLGVWTTDAFLEIFDDASDASRRIETSQPRKGALALPSAPQQPAILGWPATLITNGH